MGLLSFPPLPGLGPRLVPQEVPVRRPFSRAEVGSPELPAAIQDTGWAQKAFQRVVGWASRRSLDARAMAGVLLGHTAAPEATSSYAHGVVPRVHAARRQQPGARRGVQLQPA